MFRGKRSLKPVAASFRAEGLCLGEEILANCMDLGLLLVLFWFQTVVGKASLIVTVCSPGPAQSPETGDREGREKVTKQLSQKQDQLHHLQGWV